MKILLIMPEFKFKYTDVPIGLLSIATYIKENMFDVTIEIYDNEFENFSKKLFEFKPDIIGMYMTTLHINISKKYISLIKANLPNSKIILGGPASVSSLDELKKLSPDCIVIGEGEVSFFNYLKYHDDKERLSEIKGIILKKGRGFTENIQTTCFLDINYLNLPDYSFIDMEKYIKKWYYFDYLDNIRGTSMITSRGCPYKCKFCYPIIRNMYGLKIHSHNNSKIVSKIKEFKKKYAINSIFFHDDTFTLDKKRILDFCSMMKKEKLNIKWGCNSRVDCIDDTLCKAMKAAGCVEIRLGIESFNKDTLKFLNKKANINQINETIQIIRHNNINVFAFFIIGSPNETVYDILTTLIKISASDINLIRISILTNIPGTSLNQEIEIKSDNQDDFDYIKSSRNNCSKIPFFILDTLRKFGYFVFYFNFKRLFTTLSSFNSIDKVKSKLERL